MGDANMAGGLVQHWVAVADADGRTRLEAHWADPRAHVQITHAA